MSKLDVHDGTDQDCGLARSTPQVALLTHVTQHTTCMLFIRLRFIDPQISLQNFKFKPFSMETAFSETATLVRLDLDVASSECVARRTPIRFQGNGGLDKTKDKTQYEHSVFNHLISLNQLFRTQAVKNNTLKPSTKWLPPRTKCFVACLRTHPQSQATNSTRPDKPCSAQIGPSADHVRYHKPDHVKPSRVSIRPEHSYTQSQTRS